MIEKLICRSIGNENNDYLQPWINCLITHHHQSAYNYVKNAPQKFWSSFLHVSIIWSYVIIKKKISEEYGLHGQFLYNYYHIFHSIHENNFTSHYKLFYFKLLHKMYLTPRNNYFSHLLLSVWSWVTKIFQRLQDFVDLPWRWNTLSTVTIYPFGL